MCGIAGFINNRIDAPEVIRNMTKRMIYRGPDSHGEWTEENTGVTLGHRRLAIVDLTENGAQPMHSADGRFVISYNGEIYNAEEVKAALENAYLNKGSRLSLRGTSDTEVILEAFGALGIRQTLALMKGMFAVALYDRKVRTLTLMRDRAGEKPLYYGFVKGAFVFCSDPEVLRGYPGFDARVDRESLQLYMRYGFIPAPFSIYEGIYKLEAGSVLTIKEPFGETDIVCERYWSMAQNAEKGLRDPFMGTEKEAADQLEALLTEAIRGQMISDVPIGAFLSGGIDSPLIVSLMQKISDKPVKTFTIGFDEKKYNEAEFAKDIAKHLGTDHTELYVSEKELLNVIPRLSEIFTEPFADSSQIPTYLVSRLARSKVTVSLSGDAGDELFCGYNTYPKCEALWKKLEKLPKWLRKAGGSVLGMPGIRTMSDMYRMSMCLKADNPRQLHEAVCYHTDYLAEQLVLVDAGYADKRKYPADIGYPCSMQDIPALIAGRYMDAGLSGVKESMMYKDMVTYHPDDILVKVDRAGMAVSLENRVPMLDRDVMEFAYRLPIDYKYSADGISKKILKDILYRYVPKEMLDRPKKGFSVPLVRWLTEGETAQRAKECFAHNKLAEDGYFDAKVLDRIWKNFGKNRKNAQIVWEVLMAEQWYRRIM